MTNKKWLLGCLGSILLKKRIGHVVVQLREDFALKAIRNISALVMEEREAGNIFVTPEAAHPIITWVRVRR